MNDCTCGSWNMRQRQEPVCAWCLKFNPDTPRMSVESPEDCTPVHVEPLTPAETSTNSPEIIERLRGDRPDPRERT